LDRFRGRGQQFRWLVQTKNGHWCCLCCLCCWCVLFGWFTLVDSNSIMQKKQKKRRGNKGLIFAHHFGVVRCEKGRAPEWDGNMPWHHEGNWVTIMSDKVGWFFGPPGTYTESFSPSTHTNTHIHTHSDKGKSSSRGKWFVFLFVMSPRLAYISFFLFIYFLFFATLKTLSFRGRLLVLFIVV